MTRQPSPEPAISASRLGVQLYTLRDQMEADFEGTLERVAELGYAEVEFAGYHGRSPEEVRLHLDRLRLAAPSAHVTVEALLEDLDGQIAAAQAVGHRYLTVVALPGGFERWITPEDCRRFAGELDRIGAAVCEAGLRLAYHNHEFEFVAAGDGMTGFDLLLAGTDPELVAFELDLMWATLAGHDPVALFERYPGRFPLWHAKDAARLEAARAADAWGPERRDAFLGHIVAVGEGEIDFGRVFAHADRAGLEHAFVEHDVPADALQVAAASYEHLRSILS